MSSFGVNTDYGYGPKEDFYHLLRRNLSNKNNVSGGIHKTQLSQNLRDALSGAASPAFTTAAGREVK